MRILVLWNIFGCLVFKYLCGSKFDNVENVQDILIGYLTVDKTETFMRGKQGRVISGAITYALDLINNDPLLLPQHRLKMTWGDTMADTLVGTRLLTEQWSNGAVAFIGFEDSCSVEATVAAAWNLPLISYVSIHLILLKYVRKPRGFVIQR
ncbi:hypothetical protein ACF0H5_001204 [Mactra antiquata]